jgi:hypothetical protein
MLWLQWKRTTHKRCVSRHVLKWVERKSSIITIVGMRFLKEKKDL